MIVDILSALCAQNEEQRNIQALKVLWDFSSDNEQQQLARIMKGKKSPQGPSDPLYARESRLMNKISAHSFQPRQRRLNSA